MTVLSVDFHVKPKVGVVYAKNIDINYTDSFVQALEYAFEELSETLKDDSEVYSVKVINWAKAEEFNMVRPLPEAPEW